MSESPQDGSSMSDMSSRNLPPLPILLNQIHFPVYGLASPFLGLQLRSMHYGIDEENQNVIGLGLLYAQKYLGSPQVLAVESSLIPATISLDQHDAVIEWSWSNLVSLREALQRFHRLEPMEMLDEETIDRQFETTIAELHDLEWVQLMQQSTFPLLIGMEVSRGPDGDILARRFDGSNMLLVVSMGVEPDQFLEAMKLLIHLQEAPKSVQRHQDEFERITEG
jgi:hypothetical protein